MLNFVRLNAIEDPRHFIDFILQCCTISVSILLILQKPLRVDRGHAAAAGGGDRLAVNVILDVAAGEDAGDVGLTALVGEDVAGGIEI